MADDVKIRYGFLAYVKSRVQSEKYTLKMKPIFQDLRQCPKEPFPQTGRTSG